MLKAAFIGNENFFDRFICEWLSEHTDLQLILWTNRLSWSSGGGGRGDRARRVLRRFVSRGRRRGAPRVLNEALYYLLYRRFLQGGEVAKLKRLVGSAEHHPRKPLSAIEQARVEDIRAPELSEGIHALGLDAMFAMCIDVYLPEPLISAPRQGTFLWHEGITPEYRGVYSPFWALVNRDYERLGYTLLKMNARFDAGDIYVQGKVRDIDLARDWHSFIGHKAIFDSLPEVLDFLGKLERGEHRPLVRRNAPDGYYSYPTATGLLSILGDRLSGRARR